MSSRLLSTPPTTSMLGTASNGHVLKLDASGNASVLYDTPFEEARAIVTDTPRSTSLSQPSMAAHVQRASGAFDAVQRAGYRTTNAGHLRSYGLGHRNDLGGARAITSVRDLFIVFARAVRRKGSPLSHRCRAGRRKQLWQFLE